MLVREKQCSSVGLNSKFKIILGKLLILNLHTCCINLHGLQRKSTVIGGTLIYIRTPVYNGIKLAVFAVSGTLLLRYFVICGILFLVISDSFALDNRDSLQTEIQIKQTFIVENTN